MICRCFGVFRSRIKACAEGGASLPRDIADETRAGSGCGRCRGDIETILAPLEKMQKAVDVFLRHAFPGCQMILQKMEGHLLDAAYRGPAKREEVFSKVRQLIEGNWKIKISLRPSPGNGQK